MNFRNRLSLIKAIKSEPKDTSLIGRIEEESLIPYIEKNVSAEQLEKGVEMTIYHCDRHLLIVDKATIVYQKDFMDATDTSELFKGLKSKFEGEGLKISDVTLFKYIVTMKA